MLPLIMCSVKLTDVTGSESLISFHFLALGLDLRRFWLVWVLFVDCHWNWLHAWMSVKGLLSMVAHLEKCL